MEEKRYREIKTLWTQTCKNVFWILIVIYITTW